MLDCTASMVVYRNPPGMVKKAATTFLDTGSSCRLTIFDNSPTSDLESVFNGMRVAYHFNQGENIGYGKAHNWAFSHSEPSRYHLIFNPDIIIPSGAIKGLIEFMDLNLDVGVVCPKILNEDGSTQYSNRRHPTVLDLFLRRFLPGRLKPFFKKRMDLYEMKDYGYDTLCDPQFLTGCFMFCRTSVLKQIGGFDPRYFLHFEDADLTGKFQENGSRTVYYPNVSITHLWERAPHKSLKMAFVLIVSGIRYFNKWGWKWF